MTKKVDLPEDIEEIIAGLYKRKYILTASLFEAMSKQASLKNGNIDSWLNSLDCEFLRSYVENINSFEKLDDLRFKELKCCAEILYTVSLHNRWRFAEQLKASNEDTHYLCKAIILRMWPHFINKIYQRDLKAQQDTVFQFKDNKNWKLNKGGFKYSYPLKNTDLEMTAFYEALNKTKEDKEEKND